MVVGLGLLGKGVEILSKKKKDTQYMKQLDKHMLKLVENVSSFN